ncbi:DNA-3-methyladenine glycosylase [Lactobacillaceae bacterium Scapto_B20]
MVDKIIDDFFKQDSTKLIAKRLLGKRIVYYGPDGITSGWIVETEAYLGSIDQAAHSYQLKKTKRNFAMYEAGGTLYVHSMRQYQLMNFVTQTKGVPEGVLIRAIEPDQGISIMEANRHTTGINLTNGPGKLTQAMGIGIRFNDTELNAGPIKLDVNNQVKEPVNITSTPRIGIPNKGQWTQAPLRYIVAGNPYVSKILKSQMDLNHNGWK